MLKDTRSQKQKFMDELGHQLQRRKLDTQQMNDGLLHVKWNEQKLCTVDSSGAVRFRAGDILDAEADHQLQSVMHMAKQVKEYMQILELAPSLCVNGPDDHRKIFADFGDVVLVGSAGRKIVDFATWEWDYGRSAVYAGHFFSDNYEAAKQDFAVRAGFVNGQRLFSDQQLGVIRNACEFALEGDAALSFEEEKLLRSVQEQIEDLFPIQQEPEQELEQEQEPELEQEQEQESGLGVSVTQLADGTLRQYSLFDAADYARQEKLDTAVDALREKFGEGALFRAALLHSDERMAGGLHKKRRTGITKPIEDEAARIRKKYGNND